MPRPIQRPDCSVSTERRMGSPVGRIGDGVTICRGTLTARAVDDHRLTGRRRLLKPLPGNSGGIEGCCVRRARMRAHNWRDGEGDSVRAQLPDLHDLCGKERRGTAASLTLRRFVHNAAAAGVTERLNRIAAPQRTTSRHGRSGGAPLIDRPSRPARTTVWGMAIGVVPDGPLGALIHGSRFRPEPVGRVGGLFLGCFSVLVLQAGWPDGKGQGAVGPQVASTGALRVALNAFRAPVQLSVCQLGWASTS